MPYIENGTVTPIPHHPSRDEARSLRLPKYSSNCLTHGENVAFWTANDRCVLCMATEDRSKS